jgi:ferritin-like metal-binding protein YciE
MEDLQIVYLKKLAKTLDVEERIIDALPNMIANATNEELRAGLEQHLAETKVQRDRLSDILERLGFDEAHEDAAFRTLVAEADKELGMIEDPNVKDAVIIAAAQTVEHVEIARYGTLIEWSKELDDEESESLLKETLAEEEATDKKLSTLATGGLFKSGVNAEAANV